MYYQIALVNTKHRSLIYCVLFILGKINLSQLLVDLSPHILYGIILKEYDCLNKYHIRFMVYIVLGNPMFVLVQLAVTHFYSSNIPWMLFTDEFICWKLPLINRDTVCGVHRCYAVKNDALTVTKILS